MLLLFLFFNLASGIRVNCANDVVIPISLDKLENYELFSFENRKNLNFDQISCRWQFTNNYPGLYKYILQIFTRKTDLEYSIIVETAYATIRKNNEEDSQENMLYVFATKTLRNDQFNVSFKMQYNHSDKTRNFIFFRVLLTSFNECNENMLYSYGYCYIFLKGKVDTMFHPANIQTLKYLIEEYKNEKRLNLNFEFYVLPYLCTDDMDLYNFQISTCSNFLCTVFINNSIFYKRCDLNIPTLYYFEQTASEKDINTYKYNMRGLIKTGQPNKDIVSSNKEEYERYDFLYDKNSNIIYLNKIIKITLLFVYILKLI